MVLLRVYAFWSSSRFLSPWFLGRLVPTRRLRAAAAAAVEQQERIQLVLHSLESKTVHRARELLVMTEQTCQLRGIHTKQGRSFGTGDSLHGRTFLVTLLIFLATATTVFAVFSNSSATRTVQQIGQLHLSQESQSRDFFGMITGDLMEKGIVASIEHFHIALVQPIDGFLTVAVVVGRAFINNDMSRFDRNPIHGTDRQLSVLVPRNTGGSKEHAVGLAIGCRQEAWRPLGLDLGARRVHDLVDSKAQESQLNPEFVGQDTAGIGSGATDIDAYDAEAANNGSETHQESSTTKETGKVQQSVSHAVHDFGLHQVVRDTVTLRVGAKGVDVAKGQQLCRKGQVKVWERHHRERSTGGGSGRWREQSICGHSR